MSPFFPLHPSPSILPLPLLPVSLGSALVHLHIELLIETTSTQKKKKRLTRDCLNNKMEILLTSILFVCAWWVVYKFSLQREEKTSSTNRKVAPLPGKEGQVLQQPLRCSQEMISPFALGWDIHILVVLFSRCNQ